MVFIHCLKKDVVRDSRRLCDKTICEILHFFCEIAVFFARARHCLAHKHPANTSTKEVEYWETNERTYRPANHPANTSRI